MGFIMNNTFSMTDLEYKQYIRKQKIQRGESEFDSESEFQAAAEKWLKQCGFMPRTQAHIAKHHTGLWYLHLNKTKANPIIADFIILDAKKGRFIELEIKNGTTALSIEQTYLHKRKEITVCRNMDELKAIVFEWMGLI